MSFPTGLSNAIDGVTEIVAAHLNNLEAKVGIDNSAVPTSLDYLLRNAASIEPGHKHSKLWAAGGSAEAVTVDAAGVATFAGIPLGPASNPTTDNQLARKAYVDLMLPLAGGGMGGNIAMNNHKITGLAAASGAGEAVRYDEWIAAQDPGHKHSKLWASDGSPEAVTVDAAGNVGIGITSPGYKLDVKTSSTATSGYAFNQMSELYLNPGSSATTTGISVRGFLEIDGSNNLTTSVLNSPRGAFGDVINNNTGTVACLTGHYGQVRNYNSGTLSNAISVIGNIMNENSDGSITNAYDFYATNPQKSAGTISNAYGLYIENITSGSANYSIYTGTAKSYFGGNVGIGKTSPGYLLDMEASGGGYYAASDHAWHNGSSIRWKENIKPIEQPLAVLLQLSGVTFKWKDSGLPGMSLIAEEVGKVVPEAVSFSKEEPEFCDGFNPGALVGLLVEAVKAQQMQIDALQARLN